jgi:hypothetical protein
LVVDVLNCGQEIMLANIAARCRVNTTPIDDDFRFDIPAPPRPSPTAHLHAQVFEGPGNTIDIAPQITFRETSKPRAMVTVPLDNSGAKPSDTYARKIYVSWDEPPETTITNYRVIIERMTLLDDKDLDPGDCECTFFWVNLNRASNEWIRLADYALGDMNDYDDSVRGGDGVMRFSGAAFDFWVAEDDDFTIQAGGYDQDCMDDLFGEIIMDGPALTACYLETGENDSFPTVRRTFGHPLPESSRVLLRGSRRITVAGRVLNVSDYTLNVRIEKLETRRLG